MFYSCGDLNLDIFVNDFYVGPNYYLKPSAKKDCEDGSCYLNFIEKSLNLSIDTEFNQSRCQHNFLFQYVRKFADESDSDKIVVLCVNKYDSYLASFILNLSSKKVSLTSSLRIP